ncbi:MAG: CBS domain-containing protein [Ardenticatenaceae bacterium]|nr:CBS domain-containing protein [Anaerolineales bacterium]MCB8919942.1 CBS domain-containing protein [Ardenticatenaceae bacterium]MCB8989789.1 CBS domain-containing protein [Ardenticatenaceae bacterium]MCB9003965.1 CBS domain-containing protein [Ardenticatenaceae bacterium]
MKQGRTVLEAKRYGIFSCRVETSLLDVARLLLERDISSLVVLDEAEALRGIISRTDLLQACLEHDEWAVQTVADYMSTDVVTVTPQTLLCDVAELLLQNHIHRVVVVREEDGVQYPVAVVSDGDFIYHMVKEA